MSSYCGDPRCADGWVEVQFDEMKIGIECPRCAGVRYMKQHGGLPQVLKLEAVMAYPADIPAAIVDYPGPRTFEEMRALSGRMSHPGDSALAILQALWGTFSDEQKRQLEANLMRNGAQGQITRARREQDRDVAHLDVIAREAGVDPGWAQPPNGRFPHVINLDFGVSGNLAEYEKFIKEVQGRTQTMLDDTEMRQGFGQDLVEDDDDD